MADLEARIAGVAHVPADGWSLAWVSRGGPWLARLAAGDEVRTVLVEGSGTTWQVTIEGRRVAVEVLTRRERLLADAGVGASSQAGPLDLTASLPGLVVAVAAIPGAEVADGEPLVTIEAMKMQNEVRAPRAGRVAEVAVVAGQTVASGQRLVRIE